MRFLSTEYDTILRNKAFLTFLLTVQQVLAQVSLGREGHVTEAALRYGLLLVLVIAAHFADVFLEVGESPEQAAALITLKGSQVVVASPDMHGDCGVVTERHTTPRGVGKTSTNEHRLYAIASVKMAPFRAVFN